MKINSITNIYNKNFTARYDKETGRLLNAAKGVFDSIAVTPAGISVVKDGKDIGLVKNIDGKKICLSKFLNGEVLLQVADSKSNSVDVFYHNANDTYSDRYCKYMDNKIFPWYSGSDVKLFSKRINNMDTAEFENVKFFLKKYIPEFITGSKQACS